MINPVSNSNNSIKTSIFYINDSHGKLSNIERIYTASNAFDTFETSADKLKLSSGDDCVGEDPMANKAVSKLLDMIGIKVKQAGNHEFDVTPITHAQIAQNAKYKELGTVNIHVKPESPLNGIMVNSVIEEVNGNKYGIIGIGPSDLYACLKDGVSKSDLTVDDFNTTVLNVQKEVDKLKTQVNKIILLSHNGYANDIKLAQQTSGIDVILGGHSHDLIKDVNENKNLFYNKDGEPVVITQAGKDGEHFGVLNLEFDSKGIIQKVQNNVLDTKDYNRTLLSKYVVESYIGKAEEVGVINSAPPVPKNRLIENNPHGNFLVDAMKNELGTDIALLNAGNVRGFFEKGRIDSRQITEITPFKNNMIVANINEKELVEAIKFGGTSFNTPDNKPGIVMVSGLKYKMDGKCGKLLELSFIDKNGNIKPIDINKPDENKIYKVAMDDFYGTGGSDFYMLNKKDQALAIYDFDKDKLVCDYIKHLNKPVDIIDDKRIEIV